MYLLISEKKYLIIILLFVAMIGQACVSYPNIIFHDAEWLAARAPMMPKIIVQGFGTVLSCYLVYLYKGYICKKGTINL